MRRRTFLTAGTATAASLAGVLPLQAAAATTDLKLRLPAPTGPWPVGTTTRALTDTHRTDPWNGAPTRELALTVFYPASGVRGHRRAPQLAPAGAEVFKGLDAGLLHPELPASGVDWAATLTHSYVDAPTAPGRWPTLLYSPGGADPRTIGTSVAEDLASHGFVVVTIDHPGEASEVVFPDGRLRVIEIAPDVQSDPVQSRIMMDTRFADVRFVLDHLADLHVPIDLRRVGCYGHSAGGATAAVALEHPLVRAAVNLEGYLDTLDGELYPIAQHGTRKPLLLAGTDGFRDARFDRTWSALMAHGGPVRRIQLSHANHWIWTDYAAFAPQLQQAGLMSTPARTKLVGTAPHASHTVRRLVREFFRH
ncbi:prolyl oligopeptidase family serine peptidase [Kribbella solani]|uniref:Dienelactone hydrolase n=1 Tax=Kribbella solani TaxID=236067 RepID=A0A841DFM4_9ACTN|nr:prolyl oligopeptidase family serine peptidase [Kribbella solani]MBB5976701.1 dienelactone hydrolase [Kribbella solani]